MPKSLFTARAVIVNVLVLVLVLFGSGNVRAQDNSVFVSPSIEFMPQFYANEIVENSPVTATITIRSVQQLYDGNRIVHEDITRLYRDSRGRVRREISSGSANNVSMISLSDPVLHRTFMLDPVSKTAFTVPEIGDLIGSGKTSFEAVRLDDFGNVSEKRSVDVFIGGTSLEGGASHSDDPTMTTDGTDARHTQSGSLIAVPQGFDKVIIGKPAIDDSTTLTPGSPHWSSAGQTEIQSLGQKTIDGIRLEGTSYTTTYPPNAFGNEKSIVVKKTTWFASELRMMVRTEERDPRFGTITYVSEIISTDEPDSSLFDIPPDYDVMDSDKGAESDPEY